MKFNINQTELLNALTIVSKGIAKQVSLPVLAGVYIEAREDMVIFQATNLEMSVQYTSSAFIEERGAAVLPGKLFTDITKNLPDAAIHIEVSEESAVISCESLSFTLHCINSEDFPEFPQIVPNQQISVPFDTFASMARKVYRVASKDESHMILTGVLIAVEDNTLKLVATDSYRLAVTQHVLQNSVEDFSAVLSGGFISDLIGLPRTGENIQFALADNQIIASYHNTVFINRRLEGKFPNYKQLIPETYVTRCLVKRTDFLGAVKRASLLKSSGSHVKFSVNTASQTLQLQTVQETGFTQETLRVEIEGSDVEVGYKSSYVAEGLAAMDSCQVSLELQGSLKPGILRGEADEGYLYLIMPVRI